MGKFRHRALNIHAHLTPEKILHQRRERLCGRLSYFGKSFAIMPKYVLFLKGWLKYPKLLRAV